MLSLIYPAEACNHNFHVRKCVTDTFPAKYFIVHNSEENILHRGQEWHVASCQKHATPILVNVLPTFRCSTHFITPSKWNIMILLWNKIIIIKWFKLNILYNIFCYSLIRYIFKLILSLIKRIIFDKHIFKASKWSTLSKHCW